MHTLNIDICNSRTLSCRIYSDLLQNSPSILSVFRKDLKVNVFKMEPLLILCSPVCSALSCVVRQAIVASLFL